MKPAGSCAAIRVPPLVLRRDIVTALLIRRSVRLRSRPVVVADARRRLVKRHEFLVDVTHLL